MMSISSKSPLFPMPQPQHFSDYGFDPHFDYFQVLEEARKHKSRSMEAIRFKLQKPSSSVQGGSSKKRWWRSAVFFFKWKRSSRDQHRSYGGEDVHQARARAFRASISGPIYITDSRSAPAAPRRSSGRSASGPLAGTLTPAESDEMVGIPYVSLRQLAVEQHRRVAMPVYLVT